MKENNTYKMFKDSVFNDNESIPKLINVKFPGIIDYTLNNEFVQIIYES